MSGNRDDVGFSDKTEGREFRRDFDCPVGGLFGFDMAGVAARAGGAEIVAVVLSAESVEDRPGSGQG